MRLSFAVFGVMAALVQALAPPAAQAQADLCANPATSCGQLISPTCQRLGAGSEDASCEGQFGAYRDCLSDVAAQCATSVTDQAAGGCTREDARELWDIANTDNTCSAYAAYLRVCPDANRAEFARSRMRDLNCIGRDEPAPAPTASGRAGGVFKDCPECPEMVAIPGGTFMMGSPSSEPGRGSSEGPQRRVTIQPFAMGKYEVTFAEWDACVSAGGCSHRPGDAGWGRGARPVINVSWNDAQAYVAWLNRTVGAEVYRLPSEAEWEYAARAGTSTAYSWGDAWDASKANSGSRRTELVGGYPANAFGLYDMHGNVWEWVQDCRNGSYAGAPSNGAPWMSGDCSVAVLRGGSWYVSPGSLRSAGRSGGARGGRGVSIGFRVARVSRTLR